MPTTDRWRTGPRTYPSNSRRTTLAALDADSRTVTSSRLGGEEKALLARYVAAFESYDT